MSMMVRAFPAREVQRKIIGYPRVGRCKHGELLRQRRCPPSRTTLLSRRGAPTSPFSGRKRARSKGHVGRHAESKVLHLDARASSSMPQYNLTDVSYACIRANTLPTLWHRCTAVISDTHHSKRFPNHIGCTVFSQRLPEFVHSINQVQ